MLISKNMAKAQGAQGEVGRRSAFCQREDKHLPGLYRSDNGDTGAGEEDITV